MSAIAQRLAVLAFALASGPAVAQDIGGSYRIEGTGLDGSAYGGEAEIRTPGGTACEIVWNTADQVSQGICMRQGSTLAAAYAIGNTVGMAIYEIGADGTLRGTWTVSGGDGVGTEALIPD